MDQLQKVFIELAPHVPLALGPAELGCKIH
jgi:hypothetical protein